MALRTVHPPTTSVIQTPYNPSNVGMPGAGDGDDVLANEKGVDVRAITVAGVVPGDHVYRLKKTAAWLKWDGVSTIVGNDLSGVVHTTSGGVAKVVVAGNLVAANVTNLAAAKTAGLHTSLLNAI